MTDKRNEWYNLNHQVQCLLQQMCETKMRKSCLNCLNFIPTAEKCEKFNQRPPAHIIAFGCPDYEDEKGIPF